MGNVLDSVHRGRMWRGGRVDSVFDLCLKETGLNSAEAGHCVLTVGKLFTCMLYNCLEWYK